MNMCGKLVSCPCFSYVTEILTAYFLTNNTLPCSYEDMLLSSPGKFEANPATPCIFFLRVQSMFSVFHCFCSGTRKITLALSLQLGGA